MEPFKLEVPQAQLDDLHRRLASTRWPERETVEDWGQGAPLDKVRSLCEHWLESYDWRRCEAMLNGWGPHYRAEVDGLGIHIVHAKSPEPDALPMILTHGWPGSIIEFHKAIGPLTDPVAHGGRASDAFELVMPSLPGHGFSDKPAGTGWGVERIAEAWIALMGDLGFERWVAQGGDWGADITAQIAARQPRGLAAVHLNSMFFAAQPHLSRRDRSEDELKALKLEEHFLDEEYGYYKQQGTRPQTVGYGLLDSPVAQAAWIYEKVHAWSDHPGTIEELLTVDEILDNIMLYWLPGAGASSARIYWESFDDTALPISVPIGISQFVAADLSYAPRKWADKHYKNIVHWNEIDRGGHFAAWEQPELFVQELRTCFRFLSR